MVVIRYHPPRSQTTSKFRRKRNPARTPNPKTRNLPRKLRSRRRRTRTTNSPSTKAQVDDTIQMFEEKPEQISSRHHLCLSMHIAMHQTHPITNILVPHPTQQEIQTSSQSTLLITRSHSLIPRIHNKQGVLLEFIPGKEKDGPGANKFFLSFFLIPGSSLSSCCCCRCYDGVLSTVLL